MKKEPLHANIPYDLVDRNDRFVRIGTKADAKRLGLWGRIVHIFVFNTKDELLICKRPKTLRAYPGLWTSSVGGHVEHGEPYRKAAKRELQEELGISLPLQDKGAARVVSTHHGKKHTRLFTAHLPRSSHIAPDSKEVTAWKFISIKKLRKAIVRSPRRFVYPFRKAFMFFLKKKKFLAIPP